MGMHSGRETAWRDRCADLGLDTGFGFGIQEDRAGLNPRRRRGAKRAADWRDRRLCGQVRRAVQLGLADCGDPLLHGAVVLSVEPAARSACLRVEVSALSGVAPDLLTARLAAATPRLRADVARAIHRKKTPNLVWAVAAGSGGESGVDLDGEVGGA